MKVLGAGDTHGNTSAICNIAIPQARKHECEIIMQVGDFGYCEHTEEGRRFLDKVSKHLARNELTLYWIDGNHENHPKLWAEYAPSGPEGLCLIRPNLYYVPRGTVFKLGHVTCLGLGGAFSIDKESLLEREKAANRPGTEWWPTEMIRAEDIYFAKENVAEKGPIDIMFTHDVPVGVDIPGIHADDKYRYAQSWENRERLTEIFQVAQPKLLVHGHYHVRYTGKLPLQPKPAVLTSLEGGHLLEWDYCRVDGLGNDGFPGFAVVLDLDSLFVRSL